MSHGHCSGGKRSPTFVSWQSMLARCLNPNDPSFPRYGGRGITVCDRWNSRAGGSFENFLTDLSERPPNTTLDRIKSDKGYEPGNCRWLSVGGQQINRRKPIRQCGTTSIYRGVYWNKQRRKFRALIGLNGKQHHLGCFDSEADAALAYNDAAKKYHGALAQLNYISEQVAA